MLIFAFPFLNQAQHIGLPPIQSISPKEYKAETQNWDITQDHRGIMYFANGGGVLEFDGVDWRLIHLKHGRLARSLATDKNGLVYVGGYGDFGVLTPGPTGLLEYVSLLTDHQRKELNIKDVWKIIVTDDNIYFATHSKLIVWNNGDYKLIEPENRFHRFFYVKGKIYGRDSGIGMFYLENHKIKLIEGSEIFSEEKIYAMQEYDEDKILIGTLSKGFYLYSQAKNNKPPQFEKFNTEADKILLKSYLYQVFKLSNSNFLLATNRGGAIEINSQGKIIRQLKKSKNLIDDNIRAFYKDKQEGIWLALNNGIARIEPNSPICYWNDENGLKGSIYDIISHNSYIYIGTSTGMYKLKENEVEHLDNTQRPVWQFLKFPLSKQDTALILSYYDGIYELKNDKLKLIQSSDIAYVLLHSKKYPNRIYAGLNSGILVLERKNNQWLNLGIIKSTSEFVARYILEEENGNLWMASSDNGIVYIQVTSNRNVTDYPAQTYDKTKGLKSINSISLGKYLDHIIFSTDSGVFKFDNQKDTFLPDQRFANILKPEERIGTFFTDSDNNIWIDRNYGNSDSQVSKLIENTEGYFEWVNTPLLRFSQSVTLDFNIDQKGMLWSGGSEGLVRFNTQRPSQINKPFNTHIREVKILNNGTVFNGTFLGPDKRIGAITINENQLFQHYRFQPEINYKDNSIIIKYSASSYDGFSENKYSYFLEGFDNQWSEWKKDHIKEYTNLPANNYTFKVKSKNIYNTEGNVATYSFSILPAWYQTKIAIVLFVLLILFLIWLVINLNTHRLNMLNKSLEKKVAIRTQEISDQNKLLYQQKDEIAAQRDKIEESYNKLEEVLDELRLKNKEIFFQKQLVQDKSKKLTNAKDTIKEQNIQLQKTNSLLEKDLVKRAEELEKLYENLLDTNNELDLYIYRSAHDLRGPITRLLGLVNIAKMELKNEGAVVKDYLRKFEKTGIEMRQMQSNLLLMHNVNNHELKTEHIDWEIIILKTLDKLSKIYDLKEIEINSHIDEGIQIESDQFLLSILIEKIIENAINFKKDIVDKNHIKIEVLKDFNEIKIIIKDNGIGIEEKVVDKIFDMFSVCNEDSKGAGLGLYISKIITNKLKGEISFNTKNKKETEFNITFKSE